MLLKYYEIKVEDKNNKCVLMSRVYIVCISKAWKIQLGIKAVRNYRKPHNEETFPQRVVSHFPEIFQ